MEYNNYYPAQPGMASGLPPPQMSGSMPPNHHLHHNQPPPPMQIMQPVGPPPNGMMHSSTGPQPQQPPHQMRQIPTPGPPPPMQSMGNPPPPQNNYHQLPQHPPLSHSASPLPSPHHTPNHLIQPPSRPSTGPSPHQPPPMHQQSPHGHMNGPMHASHPHPHQPPPPQQHQSIPGPHGPSMLPPGNGIPHNQGYIGNQNQMNHLHPHGPLAPPPPHYPPQPSNQLPPMQPMHHQTGPPPPPSMHQSGPLAGPPPPHHMSQGPAPAQQPPPSYLSHVHLAGMERTSPSYQHISQTEFRIIELNRRLQSRPRQRWPQSPSPLTTIGSPDESSWWERFACDFFDDDSTLTLRYSADDKPTEYSIGRTLIPRFFRSYFDGGVEDLQIKLRNTKEMSHHNLITLVCDHATVVTSNSFKLPANPNMIMKGVVYTDGHLSLDFVSNNYDSLLIKSWRFYTHQCHEYIDRSMTTIGLPSAFLAEPMTRNGLTKSTISYLKMCMIMEPMQDLMLHHRQTNLDPRSCLRHLLYDKYKLENIEDTRAQPNKRRKRKTPANNGTGTGTTKKGRGANAANNANALNNNNIGFNSMNSSNPNNNLMSPSAQVGGVPNLSAASQDVMVVGEPSMMGSDFSDDNERTITKLENSQYESVTNQVEVSQTNQESSSSSSKNDDSPSRDKEIVDTIAESLRETTNGLQKQQHQESRAQSVVSQDSHDDSHETSLGQDTSLVKSHTTEPTSQQPPQAPTPPQQSSQKQEPEGELEKHTSAQTDSSTQSEEKVSVGVEADLQESSVKNAVESLEKEKENDSAILNDDTQMNSIGSQSETHFNIMNSIPEDREDNCRSSSCDLIVSKLPPSSNKSILPGNGTSNKQNRRRSSERKETLREGLMRTSDFVVAMKDLKCEHPALWRITTGNNLLQQFEPKVQNGVVLYENTNQYAGWNPEIKRDYVGVDVKLTQHTRNQITVERLHLNLQKIEDADAFYDKHFVIYLQILISTALDSKFWESIENDPKHRDYFMTSRRIIEDITKRFKSKLSSKLKLSETTWKNVEKYPNLLINLVDNGEKAQLCRACNTNTCTQTVTFGNRSYDLHSYKPVKVTSEPSATDDKDTNNHLCDACLEIVKLYSEIHHIGWKFFNLSKDKVDLHRAKSKPINAILDECLKDEDWLAWIYAERDALWSKVDNVQ